MTTSEEADSQEPRPWRQPRPFEPSPAWHETRALAVDILRAEGYEVLEGDRLKAWGAGLDRKLWRKVRDFPIVVRRVELGGGEVRLVWPMRHIRRYDKSGREKTGRGDWAPARKNVERLDLRPGRFVDPELKREVELRIDIWTVHPEHGPAKGTDPTKSCTARLEDGAHFLVRRMDSGRGATEVDEAELQRAYREFLADETDLHPGLSAHERSSRAMRRARRMVPERPVPEELRGSSWVVDGRKSITRAP